MRVYKFLPLMAGVLAISGCGNQTPGPAEVVAVQPKTPSVPKSATVTSTPASSGLTKKPGLPGFSLDAIGQAFDPINKPAVISIDTTVVFRGFGFDNDAKQPAKAVELILDQTAYATDYKSRRQDVADYFHAPQLEMTGFSVSIPSILISEGDHTAVVRVISYDGKTYKDSPVIKFVARKP